MMKKMPEKYHQKYCVTCNKPIKPSEGKMEIEKLEQATRWDMDHLLVAKVNEIITALHERLGGKE